MLILPRRSSRVGTSLGYVVSIVTRLIRVSHLPACLCDC